MFRRNNMFYNLTGDSWNNMRSTLERVFSHESATKSMEETKQYVIN